MAGTPDGIGFVVVGPVREDAPESETEEWTPAGQDSLSFVVVGPVTDVPRPRAQDAKSSGALKRGASVRFETKATGRERTTTRNSTTAPRRTISENLRTFSMRSFTMASLTGGSARLHHLDSMIPLPVLDRLRWVKSNVFESFWGGVIVLNTLVLVVETDYRDPEESQIGWVISDSAFTSLFLLELVLRMAALRQHWPRNPWNILDLLLVLSSVIDVWILPLLQQNFQLRFLIMLRVVRLFRMLRILRLLRLLRHSQKLVLLVHALWGALRALFWAMVLVVAVLYVFALVLTRLTLTDPYLRENPKVVRWFGTMPRSLFTLFQLMTLEGWPDIARETLDSSPWLTIFYVAFILLTNITLLNTVAGVLVENVLKTSRMDEARQATLQEQKMDMEREAVGEELENLDLNANGLLDLNELTAASADSEEAPHLAKFLDLGGISPEEAEELFRIVDITDEGTITYTDFVEAARRARGPIKSKHLVALKRDITRLSFEMDNVVSLLETVSERAGVLATAFSNDGGLSKESTSGRESTDEGLRDTVTELRREFRAQLLAMEARIPALLQAEGPDAPEARQITPHAFCCSRTAGDRPEGAAASQARL
mmetsp:Transcript_48958/g.141852  ORF Transcript_48958/g.141852 Transcript_48958/m.141852 type:complete len:600 (-) Transcript_48958:62-1861(-)